MPRKSQIHRQNVLDYYKTVGTPLSSKQLARRLHIKERALRAAISWLCLGGYLKPAGKVKAWTKPNKHGYKIKYTVNLYQWTGKDTEIRVLHIRGLDRQGIDAVRSNERISEENALMLQNIFQNMKKNNKDEP